MKANLQAVTLKEILARGKLSVEDTLSLGFALFKALDALHRENRTHGELMPGSVVIPEGAGLSEAFLAEPRHGRIGELAPESVSTEHARYLSPEQAGLVDVPPGPASDLYSAGVMLYQCASGRCPFDGANIGEILRAHLSAVPAALSVPGGAIPRAVEALILHLIEKEVDDRYQTAKAALSDLDEFLTSLRKGRKAPAMIVGKSDRRHVLAGPAFIGRAADLTALEEALGEAAVGKGGLVFLEAESGGGKTRLLKELVRCAEAGGIWTAWGQGLHQAAERPFQMMVGIAGKIASGGKAPRLSDGGLGDYAVIVASALPELREALGVKGSHELGPEGFGQVRNLEALTRLLDVLGSAERPALLVLDDCQWADDFTLKLLKNWEEKSRAEGAGNRHLLIVAAFRSEEVSRSHALRALSPGRSLVLAPFSKEEIAGLVRSMAGPVPSEAIDTVCALSNGSPFMASAVVRGLVESKALLPGADGWMAEAPQMKYLQSSLHSEQFLSRRMELLPAEWLRFLSAAAVLGKEFDLDLATMLSGRPREEAERAALEAARRHIIWLRSERRVCSFVHDKLRESLLGRLTPDERRSLHRVAAEHLEKTVPGRVFEIAYHFDSCGDSRRALPFAIAAAGKARAQHSLEIAEQNYRIALRGQEETDIDGKKKILEGLADVLLLRGDYEGAEKELLSLLALSKKPEENGQILGKLGELSFKRGNVEQAGRSIENALRLLGKFVPSSTGVSAVLVVWELLIQVLHTVLPGWFVGGRARDARSERDFQAVRLLSRLAYVYWFEKGKVSCLWAHLREMNLAERYVPTLELAQAYSEHGPVMTMIPYFSRAMRYVEKSLTIRKQFGDVWGQGQSLHFYGVALYGASRFEECIAKCREAARLLEATGDQWEVNTANWHIGFALYRLGRLDEAIEVLRRVYSSGARLGDHQATAISLSGWSKASNGQVPDGLLQEELRRKTGDVHTEIELFQGEAVRLLRVGYAEESVELLRRTDERIRKAGFQSEYVAPVLPLLATAIRCELEKARQELSPTRARALLDELGRVTKRAVSLAGKYRNNLPHALRERALFHAMAGDMPSAKRDLLGSEAAAARLGMRYELARTLAVKERLGREGALRLSPDEAKEARDLVSSFPAASDAPKEKIEKGKRVTASLVDRFETIVDIGRKIATSLTTDDVLDAVTSACMRLLRAEECVILKWDEERSAAFPFRLSTASAHREEMVRRTMASGETTLFTENQKSDVRSALCAPIFIRGARAGCFYLSHRKVGPLFGEEEARLAEFIATLAGAALENAEGFSKLRALNESLRRSSLELKRSNSDLEQFAYVASHDLKEPLRMVTSFVRLLSDEYGEKLGDEAKQYIQFAVDGATRMAELIEDLLSYSRVGRDGENRSEVDFNEALEAAKANLQSSIEESGATVTGRGLPRLWANRVQMVQLFQNLIGNAIKFKGPGKPRITVVAEKTEGAWRFSVSDNGIGIESRFADRIFVIFQRLHKREKYPGTGIGLAICKKTVLQHGGKIWVDSKVNEGSTFHFTISYRNERGPADVLPFPAGRKADVPYEPDTGNSPGGGQSGGHRADGEDDREVPAALPFVRRQGRD